MRASAAIIALLIASASGQGQCFDPYGRPRVCPNTPAAAQRGVINIQKTSGYGQVQESYREPRRVSPVELNGKIRLEFWQEEPPDEIVIQGRVWRRIR